MTTVSKAIYVAEVSWNAYATGLFTIGFSTIGGADALAVSPFDETFNGPHDNVTSRLRRVTVERGRDDNLENVLAGSSVVDLRDPTGLFNPANAASPLAAVLGSRYHPFRLRSVFGGVTRPHFYGWTDEFYWEPEGRRGVTRLHCVDLLGWLDAVKPVIAATGATTTGAAIGKILDYAGWTEPSSRSLAAGDNIPDFSADGSKTGLELVRELLEAEQGILYVSGASKAVYESRHSRASRASVATITDQMHHISPGVDFKRVRNVVRVTRTQNGYTATATDAASIDRVGERAHPTITTPYLNSNSQADGLSAHVLQKVSQPRSPLRAFEIDNRTDPLLTQVLARELVDRVTLVESEGGSGGDWHVEKLRHEITTGGRYRHSASWLLSEASDVSPFQIGVSMIAANGATSGPALVY